MAAADPQPLADDQSSASSPAAPSRLWIRASPLLVLISAAAILGLVVGVWVVLRGQSLGSAVPGTAAARPTFVIGAAPSRPVPSPSPSPQVSTVSTVAAPVEYVVQPGDTLRAIAQSTYGDADLWQRIYDANRDLIGSDPDALQAGMRLQIPAAT